MSNSNITAQPIITRQNGKLITTSLAIAQHFNKSHKNVLKAIKSLDCSAEFRQLNFEPSHYLNQQNKPQPFYEITRDGFMFLVMGFTGHQAAVWKEKYINAFNVLEKSVQQQRQILEIPAFVRKKMLELHPIWHKILVYKSKGLNNVEIAKLLDLHKRTIGVNLRQMEALQLIEPPKNLAIKQAHAKHLVALNSLKEAKNV